MSSPVEPLPKAKPAAFGPITWGTIEGPSGQIRMLHPLAPLFMLLAPALLWVILLAIVPLRQQDFPLNDDWSYSRSAFAFARGEGIRYVWTNTLQIGQWLWAFPFLRALGETHSALRLSTIVLSSLGAIAFWDLLRQESGISASIAAFSATALALNPYYFLLSGTYMNDIPALSFSLIALALYGRALANGQIWFLLLACAVATLAAITRQNALAVPLAAGVSLWHCPRLRRKPEWVLPVLLPVAVAVAVILWFNHRPHVVATPPRIPGFRHLVLLSFPALHLLGVATVPLVALTPVIMLRKRFLSILIALLACVIAWYFLDEYLPGRKLFPYLRNTLMPGGPFGSPQLAVGDRPVLLGIGVCLLFSVAGSIGAAALLTSSADLPRLGLVGRLILYFSLFHAALLLASPLLYDRYLLVLVPGALYIVALTLGKTSLRYRWGLGLAALAGFGFFSAGLMHDWLAWNQARWDLGRRALAHSIDPAEIEGGFEWDGWHSNELAPDVWPQTPPSGTLLLPLSLKLNPNITARFALSFSEIPGTTTLDSEPYSLWLAPGPRRFYLLEHQSDEGNLP